MLILWGVAAGAVAVAHYARPVFDPFARQHVDVGLEVRWEMVLK